MGAPQNPNSTGVPGTPGLALAGGSLRGPSLGAGWALELVQDGGVDVAEEPALRR